jgi:hypothetical protein
MNAHITEIGTERRFHFSAHSSVQKLSAASGALDCGFNCRSILNMVPALTSECQRVLHHSITIHTLQFEQGMSKRVTVLSNGILGQDLRTNGPVERLWR